MKNKEISVESMNGLVSGSIDILREYIGGKSVDKAMLRAAIQTLSIYSRIRSAAIQEKSFTYGVLKDLASDKEHLGKLIRANLPTVKQLEAA